MLEKGSKIFIRTVTYHYTGEVVEATDQTITLQRCAWIADSGRFADFLKSGEAAEVEPYPDDMQVSINRGAVVDICSWPHDLPRKQK